MSRYKLTIEYDGGPFCGWQRQDDVQSVQGVLEAAAAALDEAEVLVYGAGRTDAGVHALGQVAHLDLRKNLRSDTVRDGLNHHLRPHPVCILDAALVADDFHARFDATRRTYLYRLIDRRPPLTLERDRVWRVPQVLDADAMHNAAQGLVGKHDFSTFRDAGCQAKSPVKTLDMIRVMRCGPEVHVSCHALSFLHRQVRSIVGSLVEVGRGQWTQSDFIAAFHACDRQACGPVAPAGGLYLESVEYPA